MGRNLTPLYISSSFQYLVQTSGSEFQDGLGNTLTSVNITASEATYALTAASATTATSASHALIADTALNVPSINTGSLLENASVTDAVTTYTRADGTTFATTAINNVANATSALIAVSASHAVIADSALTATSATSASYALNATNADNAISASYSVTASYALNAGGAIDTGSLMVTGSVVSNTLTFTKGNGTTFDLIVADTTNTGSFVITASISDATTTYTKGDGSTFGLTVNNVVNANSASYVLGTNVDGAVASATSASHALIADLATTATTATSSSYASTALSASYASTATSASYALDSTNAQSAQTAVSASYATTASFAENVTPQVTSSFMITGSVAANVLTFTKGDASTFALTLDTGSFVDTGSYIRNDADIWASTPKITEIVTLTQAEYDGIGVPDPDTIYVVPGGVGTFVTASYAISSSEATHALTADTATSASYALTATTADTATSASYATTASYAENTGPIFPYTGSVNIFEPGGDYSNNDEVIFAGIATGMTPPFSGSNNSKTYAFGVTSSFIGSTAENYRITNNSNVFVAAVSREQYTPLYINGMSGSAIIASGPTINAGYDASYTNAPINSAMLAASGQFRGGMYNSAMIAHNGGNMNGTSNYGGGMLIAGGTNATQNRNFRSVIIGGNSNSMPTSFNDSLAIFGGGSNNAYGNQNNIVGCESSAVNGGSYNNLFGTRNGTISSGGDTTGIFGGWNNTISTGHTDYIFGGNNNTFTNRNTNQSAGNVIIGGLRNQIESDNMEHNIVLGGADHNISGSIQGGAIVAGSGSLVSHDRSVIIGGYNMSTQESDTVYVPKFVASGSVRGEVNVISDSAGTTTMDCSLGNFFTLAMPSGGTTALTPSNIQPGQTISVKITQNATAALLTFAASIEFEGGTAFTISTGSGEVDVMTFISFDGTTLQATGLTNFS